MPLMRVVHLDQLLLWLPQAGPTETHWDYEHFLKVSEEDFMHDVVEEGYVDVAIFQSTYLSEWYLERCQEFGIKNSYVHKGPTIWPLDKDAFDAADIDGATTAPHRALDNPGVELSDKGTHQTVSMISGWAPTISVLCSSGVGGIAEE
jgi:hypothetical protein